MKGGLVFSIVFLAYFFGGSQLNAQGKNDSDSVAVEIHAEEQTETVILDSLNRVLEETTIDSIKSKLYVQISRQHLNHHKLDLAMETCQKGIEVSKKADFQKGIISLLLVKGAIYTYSNKPEMATKLDKRVLAISDSIGYDKGRLFVHNKFGYAFKDALQFDSALVHFRKALDMAISIGNKGYQSNLYASIAYVLLDSDRDKEALEPLTKSLAVAKDMNDAKAIASALNNLGSYYKNASRYPTALNHFLEALRIYEEVEFDYMIAGLNNNIGDVYKEQKKYTQAIQYYTTALRINLEIGNPRWQSINYINLANIYNTKGEFEKALEYSRQALAIDLESKSYKSVTMDTLEIGLAHVGMLQYEKAHPCFREAVSLAKEYELITEYSEASKALSELYLSMAKNNADATIKDNDGAVIEPSNYLPLARQIAIDACENDKKIDGYILQKSHRKQLLSSVYFTLGEFEKAYETQLEFKALEDSVFSIEKEMQIRDMGYERKLLTDSLKNEQEKIVLEAEHKEELAKKEKQRSLLMFSGIGILLLAGGLYGRLRYTNKAKRIIEKEKQRSDELLLNILPAEVAEELKEKGETEAHQFDTVSILFTDFKEFTQASEKLTPKDLVAEINHYFKAFDLICEKYGVEKIKTIGDAYMAAAGLKSGENKAIGNASTLSTINAAFEMQAFVTNRSEEQLAKGLPSFKMRLGIHTGPVVAGIVGVKKFQYDIWGDTVNTAARMESHGEVSKVNISDTAYQILQDTSTPLRVHKEFEFEEREKLEVKGKGAMKMWFVSRISQ